MSALHRSLAVGFGLSALTFSSPASAQWWNLIVGGDPAPEFESVGAFLHGGEAFCTGTIIAPRVVLTAAHCLSDLSGPDGVGFFLGPDSNILEEGVEIPVTELHVHPDYAATDNADIAVAILAEDADVEPIAVNFDGLDSSLIGTEITFVGYGLVSPNGAFGEKRKVVIEASGVSDFFIDYETPGKNTCQGDSGGPAFVFDGDVATILGVTSYGDAECAVDGHNTRTDVFAGFVEAFLDGEWEGDPELEEQGQVPIEPGTDPDDGEGDVDFCEEFEWYDDGVCDECPNPDPDCEGEDPDEFEDEGEDEGCAGGGVSLLVAWLALLPIARRRIQS